tara:strand:- start:118 stop:351 length:234 start_codon:yes stop_codon:yes gene_type:complete
MKITREQLKQIIKEELTVALDEAHGMSAEDADKFDNLISMLYDEEGEMERILKYLIASNVEVDHTQDMSKTKKGDDQ